MIPKFVPRIRVFIALAAALKDSAGPLEDAAMADVEIRAVSSHATITLEP